MRAWMGIGIAMTAALVLIASQTGAAKAGTQGAFDRGRALGYEPLQTALTANNLEQILLRSWASGTTAFGPGKITGIAGSTGTLIKVSSVANATPPTRFVTIQNLGDCSVTITVNPGGSPFLTVPPGQSAGVEFAASVVVSGSTIDYAFGPGTVAEFIWVERAT